MAATPRRLRPRVAGRVCLLLALTALAAGCYGKFPLTRAIYTLNGQASQSKWARSACMWIFALPLYTPAALTDVAVFNVVEFWTGATLSLGDEPSAPPPPTQHRTALVLRRLALARVPQKHGEPRRGPRISERVLRGATSP